MKVLITGGAGFLGSHLCDYFLARNYDVVALDDLSTGSLRNIGHLRDNGRFEFVNHDVREPISIQSDLILNFACPASPIHYQQDPVKTIETNFLGIINMLHLSRENQSILVQASTSEVYGDPLVSPQSEEYWGNVNPIGIRSCYDEGKRAAETLCFDYRRQYGLDTRVIRIFNTFGPRMAEGDGRVVSNFIVQALKNEDITIYGEGMQTRSFCFVDDLVSGIGMFALSRSAKANPLNLGNPVEFTVYDLAKTIIEITGSASKIVHRALPEDDPRQRKPDISKAKGLLGWEPKITLREGLLRTIRYFENQLSTQKLQ